MQKNEMIYVDIDDVRPFDKNPRNNRDAINDVATSISRHDMNQPIVVNQDMVICVGHTRWLACKRLKHKQIPVIVKKMSQSQFKAYNLADNRTGENAKWNYDLVTLMLKEIDDDQPSLLKFTGFTNHEIDSMLKVDDDEIDIIDEHGAPKGSKQTHHKVVTMFLDETTMPIFLEQVEFLQDYFETDNMTNTVLKTLEKVFKDVKH